jgi:hypothetical protein
MSVPLAAFASELVKLSEAKDKERKSGYGRKMLAALPFAAATGATDVPKGWVDKYVEQTIRGVKDAKETPLRAAYARGAGRFGAGLVTSPVFLSGLKDLRSEDKDTRRRGYAKVVGAGTAFSAMKGGIEGGVLGSAGGRAHALKKIKGIAGARGIVGLGGGVLTARAAASAMGKKSEKGKKDSWKKYVVPAAAGAAIGAGEGAFEEAWTKGLKGVTRRGLAAGAGGRAAASAIGTVALAGLAKKLAPGDRKRKGRPGYRLAPSKKDPNKKRWQKVASAEPPDLYTETRQWAQDRNDVEVYSLAKRVNAEGLGERTQSRRAAYYALHDELRSRGHHLPEPPRRREVEKRAPRRRISPGAVGVATLAVAPGIVAAALMDMPASARDSVLDDALDRMYIKDQMHRVVGEPMAWTEGMPTAEAQKHGIRAGERAVQIAPRGKSQAAITAHELGHMQAGDLRRATIGSQTAQTALRRGRIAATAIPIAVLMSAGDTRYATPEELERKARLVSIAGTVTTAMQLPGVAEEVAANARAVKLLESVGDTKALSRVVRQAGPGFATYAAPLLIPAVAARHLRRRAKDQRRKS